MTFIGLTSRWGSLGKAIPQHLVPGKFCFQIPGGWGLVGRGEGWIGQISMRIPNLENLGTSLVVQWLRICLPVQGIHARFLVRNLRSHMLCQATKPKACYNKDPAQPKKKKERKKKKICPLTSLVLEILFQNVGLLCQWLDMECGYSNFRMPLTAVQDQYIYLSVKVSCSVVSDSFRPQL